MTKMSEFRKNLRIAEKLAKHVFRNMNLKSTYESINGWDAEGFTLRIKKSVRKDNRGQGLKTC